MPTLDWRLEGFPSATVERIEPTVVPDGEPTNIVTLRATHGNAATTVVVPRERLDQPMWCTIYRSQLTRELERLAHPRGE